MVFSPLHFRQPTSFSFMPFVFSILNIPIPANAHICEVVPVQCSTTCYFFFFFPPLSSNKSFPPILFFFFFTQRFYYRSPPSLQIPNPLPPSSHFFYHLLGVRYLLSINMTPAMLLSLFSFSFSFSIARERYHI